MSIKRCELICVLLRESSVVSFTVSSVVVLEELNNNFDWLDCQLTLRDLQLFVYTVDSGWQLLSEKSLSGALTSLKPVHLLISDLLHKLNGD